MFGLFLFIFQSTVIDIVRKSKVGVKWLLELLKVWKHEERQQ